MAENGHSRTKKVQMEDGEWVEVRRVTGSVLAHKEEIKHDRGWDSEVLDILAVLPDLIVTREHGAIDREFTDELSEPDILRVWGAAKGVDLPPQSAPSFAGTGQGAGAKKKRRSSG